MFTRKNGKAVVVTIEFPEDMAKCEKTLNNGLNSLVAFKAKWCGACHQFNGNVWNSLTKLKHRNMNLISVDSEVAPEVVRKLNVSPPQFYPTIMLVGNDGKAATFKGPEGETNAMPRKNTPSEDKKMFTTLVTAKTPNLENESLKNMSVKNTSVKNSSKNNSVVKINMKNEISIPRANKSQSLKNRENIQSLAKSPFAETSTPSMSSTANRTVRVESVADDLIASRSRSPTATSDVVGKMKGGRMLKAIKDKTAALKAMLRQTYNTVTRRRSRK
jgi:thioredoxin-like negative regulator of GroEL